MSSKKKRRIAVVTGSRAEYGLLFWLLKELKKTSSIQLQLIVTGMHLSPEFGLTYKGIEDDGFTISSKVEMLCSSDSTVGMAKSVGLGIIGFCDAFMMLKPDLVLITGDRFEMFSAATAAMCMRIPIAHIGGGENSEGAIDEAIRHSMTKMSHVHFCSNKQSYEKILQLGEDPAKVFCVGSLGLDILCSIDLLSRQQLYSELKLDINKGTAIVVHHPVTLEKNTSKKTFGDILAALDRYAGNIIFLGSNADADGRIINEMIKKYVKKNARAKYFINLDRRVYFSLLKHAEIMLGNSSSGICEAPSFRLPVVNIGERQKGRVKAKNNIDVGASTKEISEGMKKALSAGFKRSIKNVKNPYFLGRVGPKIASILDKIEISEDIIKKGFVKI